MDDNKIHAPIATWPQEQCFNPTANFNASMHS